jgi:salicylate hydroxylase
VLREVGAGLVVPPNMVRPLARLGLADALPGFAVRLQAAWEFRRWQNARVLFTQPMGEECERLYGAPCFVAHRADLLALLQRALPEDQLRLDHRCVDVQPGTSDDDADKGRDGDRDRARLRFVRRDGSIVETHADAVIGADGIHSVVAPLLSGAGVPPSAPARFSGLCAFRFLVPAAQAPTMALRPVQTLWLGPGRHLVHYPISGGRLVNVVAIVPAGDWRAESWTAEGRVEDVAAEFSGWHDDVAQLIASARETKRWALYDRDPAPHWARGRVALLGDAVHAMLPFFAQGAAQAIEDAEALAACVRGADTASLPQALQRYEARRRPRASEVQLMSRGREIRNHLPDGPEQQQRDAEFANGDPLRQSAWLYGHDGHAGPGA